VNDPLNSSSSLNSLIPPDDKLAIVTGGLSGIGFAIAQQLQASGAQVVIASRGFTDPKFKDIKALEQYDKAATTTSEHPGSILGATLDVTDSGSIERLRDQVHEKLGSIDILVNAAGVSASTTVDEHSDSEWESVIDTNLNGAFRMTRLAISDMKPKGWGRIVNIGSTAAETGHIGSAAYCASKAGLLGLTRCVALEGAADGITCNMVSPTWVDTPMMRNSMQQLVEDSSEFASVETAMQAIAADNPQKRLIESDEIAALVNFLCSENAKGITMENIQVSGGALW